MKRKIANTKWNETNGFIDVFVVYFSDTDKCIQIHGDNSNKLSKLLLDYIVILSTSP